MNANGTLGSSLHTPNPAPRPSGAMVTKPGTPIGDLPRWIDTLEDGTQVLIRILRKDDADLERTFIHRLSPESRRLRFLGQIAEPSDELVHKLVDIDYTRDLAFVALVTHAGEEVAAGISRYSLASDALSCECTVAVADEWQNKGLGTLLMRRLIAIARKRGIHTMVSIDSAENWRMRELAEDLGFTRETDPGDARMVIHRLQL